MTSSTTKPIAFKGKPFVFDVPKGMACTFTPARQKRRASRYLADSVDPHSIKRIVREACKQLRAHRDEFDGIAVTGLSGLLIAPIVALRIGKPLIVVRKPGITTHADCKVEAAITEGRYVLFDDMTRSGATLDRIRERIAEELPGLRPVAVYLYREDSLWSESNELPLWSRMANIRYASGPSALKGYYPSEKKAA